jgi:LPS-assembly protein
VNIRAYPTGNLTHRGRSRNPAEVACKKTISGGRRNITALSLLVVVLMSPPSISFAQDEDKATVSADTIKFMENTGLLMTYGGTKIHFKDFELSGDQCIMDSKNSLGLMDGNVHLTMPKVDIRAKMMEFNLETGFGTLTDAKGVFGTDLIFTANKVGRTERNAFTIWGGAVTSCPEKYKEWEFRAEELKIRLEGLAIFKDVSLRFYDVPVFYSPYWFAPAVTTRSTGFLLPNPGYSSTSGLFLNNSFYWAISEQDDATLYLDAMALRGTHEGVEYRYAFAERLRGQFVGDYLDDQSSGAQLYSVKYKHAQQVTDHIDAIANLDLESKISYSKQFNTDAYLRTRAYTDSTVNIRTPLDT